MLCRIRALSVALIALAIALSACSQKSPAPSPGTVKRVVSLSPSTTELLASLGAIEALVGRDKYSIDPPEVLKLPVLGDFRSPNVEAIVGLRPDLVLLDTSQQRTADALAALDVRTLSLQMHQVEDLRRGLQEVGKAMNRSEQARALVANMDDEIATHAARAKERSRHPKLLFIIDRSPDSLRNLIAAGPKTYLDELLTIVGGVNMMAGSPVRYPQLSAEQILRGAPDIIIDLSKAGDGISAYDSVRESPAYQHRRIHIIDERLLLSPSPRLGEALDRLARLLDMQSAL